MPITLLILSSLSYLKRDECREREVLVGEHEEHHLGGDEHHHPRHQHLLPREVRVDPPRNLQLWAQPECSSVQLGANSGRLVNREGKQRNLETLILLSRNQNQNGDLDEGSHVSVSSNQKGKWVKGLRILRFDNVCFDTNHPTENQ